jgi:Tfp pilus assembly protein PilF
LRAKAIADEAAARWPTNLAALTAAYTVATRQNDVAAQKKYLDRMIEIEPDNAAMRQARASLDPAGVRSS